MHDPAADSVLEFWFSELAPNQWFRGSKSLDEMIRARFGGLLDQGRRGELDDWAKTPLGRLALIIVLDQFSRNVFRGTPEAFAADEKARGLTLEGIAQGADTALSTSAQKIFFYMPLMHAEDGTLQALCTEKLAALGDDEIAQGSQKSAREHAAVIARFGRFPHRNA
ncbi:MAG TPA: DUF924 family protein, partial [Rhizomicrobium sp.]|nr:DUF924 family protein [Rhizomicrobium sp.]